MGRPETRFAVNLGNPQEPGLWAAQIQYEDFANGVIRAAIAVHFGAWTGCDRAYFAAVRQDNPVRQVRLSGIVQKQFSLFRAEHDPACWRVVGSTGDHRRLRGAAFCLDFNALRHIQNKDRTL